MKSKLVIAPLAILGSVLATAAWTYHETRMIAVESHDGRYKSVHIDDLSSVRIRKQMSDTPCRLGRTWGWDRGHIWVDNGCRALFEYTKDDRRHDYRGRTIRVRLESEDRRYRRYNADIRGDVQLIRQISDAPCRLGRSWGFDRNGLWVDNGCRADFVLQVR